MKDPRSIIRLPIITEKSTQAREDGWYVFSVDRRCNKKEIQDSVEKIFGVKVDKVRTLVLPGKRVKRFGRVVGKRSAVKKAYVKLREGEINLFEGA